MAQTITVTANNALPPGQVLANVLVTITQSGSPIAYGLTDGTGVTVIDVDGFTGTVNGSGTKLGWGSSSSFTEFLVGIGGYTHFVTLVQNPRSCFKPVSSWVFEVCWIPTLCNGEGAVAVTFHRRGTPYFRCYYPGTTYRDFEVFELVGSKGEHVNQFYRPRAHVPYPLLA